MSSQIKRMTFFTTAGAIILVLALLAADTDARSLGRIRQKRVSDQRLAELETLLALEKIRGQLVTVPVAFGRVDPAKIGRRRRSSVDNGLQRLQHLLEVAAAQDTLVADLESDESAQTQSIFSNNVKDRREEETEEQIV